MSFRRGLLQKATRKNYHTVLLPTQLLWAFLMAKEDNQQAIWQALAGIHEIIPILTEKGQHELLVHVNNKSKTTIVNQKLQPSQPKHQPLSLVDFEREIAHHAKLYMPEYKEKLLTLIEQLPNDDQTKNAMCELLLRYELHTKEPSIFEYVKSHSLKIIKLCYADYYKNKIGTQLKAFFLAQPQIINIVASSFDVQFMQDLLNQGASINTPDEISGKTALMNARSEAMVDLLVRYGACHKKRDKLGDTALHYFTHHIQALKALLSMCPDVNIDAKNKYRNTPLHYACNRTNPEIAKVLLNAGADSNIQNFWGYTPLLSLLYQQFNISSHQENIVKQLLDHGANVRIKSYKQKTALQIAQEKGFHNLIDILKKAEEDTNG